MPMKIYRVIGLMSGTSLDGVDAALLRTDGESHIEREAFLSMPYDADLRAQIRAVFGAEPGQQPEKVRAAAQAVTVAHAETIHKLLEMHGIQSKNIDLIGFHGQTISHAPDRGWTCQI